MVMDLIRLNATIGRGEHPKKKKKKIDQSHNQGPIIKLTEIFNCKVIFFNWLSVIYVHLNG